MRSSRRQHRRDGLGRERLAALDHLCAMMKPLPEGGTTTKRGSLASARVNASGLAAGAPDAGMRALATDLQNALMP
jgi:hypothetical protein